jgi:hypothetical protein
MVWLRNKLYFVTVIVDGKYHCNDFVCVARKIRDEVYAWAVYHSKFL